MTISPRALAAGVEKAPRHEVAGSWALAGGECYGDLMLTTTLMVGATLARGELHGCLQGRLRDGNGHLGGRLERINGQSAH